MERHWRVHHPVLPVEPDVTIELSPAESHHVHRVLRLRKGDGLSVFDGNGRERSGVVVGGGPGGITLRLQEEVERQVEAPVEIELFQALCRPDRMEWVIQKATEIGVGTVHPFPAERAEGRAPTPDRLERWRRIAIEACKQSGRRRVPAIEPGEDLPAPPPGRTAILLDGGSRARPLGELLVGPGEAAVWIAVGPESGLAAHEVDRALELGWRAGHLGPRTLRTETAGLVAATIVLHRWGDLGPQPEFEGHIRSGG
jgi:16S rRNA (uracil1498-N3)-methyltransferase